jgi:DNA-binding MarR family transcriptional regulator
MSITNQEFKTIHIIEFMNYNNPKQISEELGIDENGAKKLLKNLEEKELITIEYREDKIYGSKLTKKGKNIWDSKEFKELKIELGY